jgi:hypothetical protein
MSSANIYLLSLQKNSEAIQLTLSDLCDTNESLLECANDYLASQFKIFQKMFPKKVPLDRQVVFARGLAKDSAVVGIIDLITELDKKMGDYEDLAIVSESRWIQKPEIRLSGNQYILYLRFLLT